MLKRLDFGLRLGLLDRTSRNSTFKPRFIGLRLSRPRRSFSERLHKKNPSFVSCGDLFIYLFVPESNVLVTTVVSYTDWSLHFNELKGSDARMYDLRLEVQLGEK